MKKLTILLCLAVLLTGCASGGDTQPEAVRQQILALPAVEEFQSMDAEGRLDAYARTQEAHDAYMALTEAQRQQIPEAEGIFDALFSHFNSLIMPIEETQAAPSSASEETAPAETVPELPPLEPVRLTAGKRQLLAKLGMAERGDSGCPECIALVMCTVLNRVESPKFAGSVSNVIYSKDQFTPVSDGTFETVVPGELCYDALDMVESGWDESRGALFYEWCEGESWHSQNLKLLFQHCDTRFYDFKE